MKFLPKEAWRYALLLIILFAIAAVTVHEILKYLKGPLSPEHYRVISLLMSALTLGFMLIAGAFGLWAIRFSAEAESRRRIGRFVDAMDYLSDGILTLDRKGQVTGSNPVVGALAGKDLPRDADLAAVFPCLSERDISQLLNDTTPFELERTIVIEGIPRSLRFRSQPSEDLSLLLISDITAMNAQLQHNRQVARLQLIGQIARGVAHDFNNLLCVISGNASLLTHVKPGSEEMLKSITQITKGAEKGIALAGHLLELAHPARALQPTDVCHEYVELAVQGVKDSLPDRWKVETDIHPLPLIALTGIQIEQIVTNLAFLCADMLPEPGILRITAAPPQASSHLLNVGNQFAAVLIVAGAVSETAVSTSGPTTPEPSRESGVILSVIRSMVEEAGGALEFLRSTDGSPIYRLALPYGTVFSREEETPALGEFAAYVTHWSVLLATTPSHQNAAVLDKRMRELKVEVTAVDNIMSALAHIEKEPRLDAIVVERNLLRQEAEGLLRAIVKLRPSAGIVVLSEDPGAEPAALSSDIVFVSAHSDADKVLLSIIEAKSLAVRRKHIQDTVDLDKATRNIRS